MGFCSYIGMIPYIFFIWITVQPIVVQDTITPLQKDIRSAVLEFQKDIKADSLYVPFEKKKGRAVLIKQYTSKK